MPIFQITPTELKALSETTFGAEGIAERKDATAPAAGTSRSWASG